MLTFSKSLNWRIRVKRMILSPLRVEGSIAFVCNLYANQQITVFGRSVICLSNSDSRRIRTFDLLLRRQLLYPAELWNRLVQKRRPEVSFCRGGRIRTYDLLLPKQARYRATLHLERSAKIQIFPG